MGKKEMRIREMKVTAVRMEVDYIQRSRSVRRTFRIPMVAGMRGMAPLREVAWKFRNTYSLVADRPLACSRPYEDRV